MKACSRRLVPSFGANRIFDRLAAGGERRVELLPQRAGRGSCSRERCSSRMTNAGMRVGRPRAPARVTARAMRRARSACEPLRARWSRAIGPHPQVFDQRQLERARPRPQLAHRQRRDGLEGGDEAMQALRIEAAGAVPDELEGHRVDARGARRTRRRRSLGSRR